MIGPAARLIFKGQFLLLGFRETPVSRNRRTPLFPSKTEMRAPVFSSTYGVPFLFLQGIYRDWAKFLSKINGRRLENER